MRIALGLEYDGRALHGWQTRSRRDRRGRTRSSSALSESPTRRSSTVAAGPHRCRRPCGDPGRALRHRRASCRHCLGSRRQRIAAASSVRSPLGAVGVPADFHARFAATGAALHLSAARSRRCGQRCSPAASAGTISRLRSTLCATAADALAGRRTIFRPFAPPNARRNRRPGRSTGFDIAREDGIDPLRSSRRRRSLHHMVRNIVSALASTSATAASRRRGSPNCSPSRDRTRAAPTFARRRSVPDRRRLCRRGGIFHATRAPVRAFGRLERMRAR